MTMTIKYSMKKCRIQMVEVIGLFIDAIKNCICDFWTKFNNNSVVKCFISINSNILNTDKAAV